ncbi:hypothetical protein [Streptomyces sp. NPDC056660]|uniref:hypothetical protein n=1 Tax=Streptomyces sp. NPDC056660 TaxID=3345897 RepID=UPI0036AAC85D
MDPAGFVARHELTHWFSVPSVVSLAGRLRRLGPNSMPTLRYAAFAGEPLPLQQAGPSRRSPPCVPAEPTAPPAGRGRLNPPSEPSGARP